MSDTDFDLDDPEAVMREARTRFIEAFPGRLQSIRVLFDQSTVDHAMAPSGSLRRMVHQMVGIAGTLGLSTVSDRAAVLEHLVIAWNENPASTAPDQVRAAMTDVERAFQYDLSQPTPDWAVPQDQPTRARILMVEDDDDLRKVVMLSLRTAGYQVTGIGNGAEAVERAHRERPALILLDVDLPGMNGHVICRKLKASPELQSTPVMFMTTRASMNDRLIGQALGADDYLTKPIDLNELRVRIELLLRDRPVPAVTTPAATAALLTYEAFVGAAEEILQREVASLAFMSLPPGSEDLAVASIAQEARRRDVLARYDPRHVLWLLPTAPLDAATQRVREVSAKLPGVRASVVTAVAGTRSLEMLMAEVDTAIEVAGGPRNVLLADDDPTIMRIIDAQLRSAGYKTKLVFDGQAATEAVDQHQPIVLVLDLMMPKRTGFDVLTELSGKSVRPRVIVLSARGREEDITRAFALGADDYMTKPFSPQELLARVARLAK